MAIKRFIAKLFPKLCLYKKNFGHCRYEFERFMKYSILGKTKENPRFICTQLKLYIHVIEKGFSMKNTKVGFGKEKLKCIVNWLDMLNESGNRDYDRSVYKEAVSILNYYHGYALENGVDDSFIPERYLDQSVDVSEIGSRRFSVEEMRNLNNMNFYDFAHARHSFRYYRDIPLKRADIENAVRLAQTAPSACNRQSVKVYCINEKEKSAKILKIQEGANGFEGVNSVFIVTSDIADYTYQKEYSAAYVDGALFIMNLLYSLNYYNIASCPLMFDDCELYGKQVREIIDIPQNEIIVGIVSAGYYEDGDMVAAYSKRKDLSEVLIMD